MTKEQLKQKLKELEDKYLIEQKSLYKEYCFSNNPYKIGDTFTDHIGSIKIEAIKFSAFQRDPSCVYEGTILNKDGTPNKKGKKRSAWQLNESK